MTKRNKIDGIAIRFWQTWYITRDWNNANNLKNKKNKIFFVLFSSRVSRYKMEWISSYWLKLVIYSVENIYHRQLSFFCFVIFEPFKYCFLSANFGAKYHRSADQITFNDIISTSRTNVVRFYFSLAIDISGISQSFL